MAKNLYILHSDYAQIDLENGKNCLVDVEDVDRLSKYRWHLRNNYIRHSNYINGKRGCVLLHRFIMQCPDDKWVDHKNRNTFDNRKCNLRIVSASQNNMNKCVQPSKGIPYKGVFWKKERNIWHAAIREDGIQRHLGYFPDIKDAARAYNKRAIEVFGEFAHLNQVED